MADLIVTRFDKFSPLLGNIINFRECFESLLNIWHIFEPTLTNFVSIVQFFINVNGQILKNKLATWSHWPTLILQTYCESV